MLEPAITCPQCNIEIKLTESLAAPLIQATRREFEIRLAQKDADVAKQETMLRDREAAIARARELNCFRSGARLPPKKRARQNCR